jgi:hypothetical protein
VLALAHNGNLSNGLMFPVDAQYTGRAIDENYVQLRAKWEPLYEPRRSRATAKRTPSSRPTTPSPTSRPGTPATSICPRPRRRTCCPSTLAKALKTGLLLESRLGTNPYKFGMVGSTDSHTALSSAEEENFFGKHAGSEPSPPHGPPVHGDRERRAHGWQEVRLRLRRRLGDREHPRGDLGRNGPPRGLRHHRPADHGAPVRRLGFLPAICRPRAGCRGLRPRRADGRDLRAAPQGAEAPTFMVYALRDPIGANLDRIQIVKGWLDADGETQERVYDVAWSAGREPDGNGVLPPVGNTVDLAKASWRNTIGARNWERCGAIRTSIQRSGPSTTPACSRSPRHAGSSTTPSASAGISPKVPKRPIRSAPTPRRSGTRRSKRAGASGGNSATAPALRSTAALDVPGDQVTTDRFSEHASGIVIFGGDDIAIDVDIIAGGHRIAEGTR